MRGSTSIRERRQFSFRRTTRFDVRQDRTVIELETPRLPTAIGGSVLTLGQFVLSTNADLRPLH